MHRRLQDAGAGQQRAVEYVEMSIGIAELPADIVDPGEDVIGDVRADMRHAQDDRARARDDFDVAHDKP